MTQIYDIYISKNEKNWELVLACIISSRLDDRLLDLRQDFPLESYKYKIIPGEY